MAVLTIDGRRSSFLGRPRNICVSEKGKKDLCSHGLRHGMPHCGVAAYRLQLKRHWPYIAAHRLTSPSCTTTLSQLVRASVTSFNRWHKLRKQLIVTYLPSRFHWLDIGACPIHRRVSKRILQTTRWCVSPEYKIRSTFRRTAYIASLRSSFEKQLCSSPYPLSLTVQVIVTT